MANQFTDAVFHRRFEHITIPTNAGPRRVGKSDIKLVAFCLAWRMNKKNVCWPSITLISEDTGLTRSMVSYCIKAMQQAGLLTVVGGDSTKSSRYMLRLDQPPEVAPQVNTGSSKGEHPSSTGEQGSSKGELGVAPQVGTKASMKASRTSSMKASGETGSFRTSDSTPRGDTPAPPNALMVGSYVGYVRPTEFISLR